MTKISVTDLERTLINRFGLSSFKPGQAEAIIELFEKKKVLCILPTGYGKSLIYQLPSVMLEGMTVVVSPLLALVRDQLVQLEKRFGISAGAINSDQTEEENQQVKSAALQGKLKILFIAPEQLDNLESFEFLLKLQVALVVVDEAHCISVWGHDFRPSYRSIVKAVEALKSKNSDLLVLGLTATANKKTEEDIQLQLGAGEPLTVIRRSMDRPNLTLSVVKLTSEAQKLEWLQKELTHSREGTTVIYCATRENTEMVAEFLQKKQITARAYHAGLSVTEKRELQSRFFSGTEKLLVATNALGMGIDKSDVRQIIHYDVPGSITAYYQEVGRAGRDGLPAKGSLLYLKDDLKIQKHFIRSAQPSENDFQTVFESIAPDKNGSSPGITSIKARSGAHPTIATVVLAELIEQGFVEKVLEGRKQVYIQTGKQGEPDRSRYKVQEALRNAELDGMIEYAEMDLGGESNNSLCLMKYLRERLGDMAAEKCSRCSSCKNAQHLESDSYNFVEEIDSWLASRPAYIAASTRPRMLGGIAILDGSRKTAQFVNFMRGRASSVPIPEELLKLIFSGVEPFVRKGRFHSVVVVPSRTWAQRQQLGTAISGNYNLTYLPKSLDWIAPAKRQGELLNNDQRRENVNGSMFATGVNNENVLLIDDYTGSGASLKEATRALLDSGASNVVPVTVARVKWKIGAAGML